MTVRIVLPALAGILALSAATIAFAQTDTAPIVLTKPVAAAPTVKAKTEPAAKTQSGGGGNLNMGHHDTNAPINVSADNFEGDMQNKIGTYIGNVIIVQGDFKLRADKVAIHEVANKPSVINGYGNVLFVSTSGTASGDTGVYDLGPRTITLDGKVIITKEKNVMRGTHAVMNLDTGIAHITAKGMPGGRVQGVFTPPPKEPAQSQTSSKSP
jgi:lipopolysaccharide export system protein LptA